MLHIDENMNISITRGDTAEFIVDIYDEEGNPYTLDPATEKIVFTVKRLYTQTPALIQKESNTNNFYLISSDTDNLSFGSYKYDIVLISESLGVDTFIYEKDFNICEEVHNLEEVTV